jgi:hypothetical protein
MSILSCFQHIIPDFHAFSDEDQRYNLGATWTAADGLKDYHNLELRYVHNSERLALQGDPQPDGALMAAVRSKIQYYRRIYLDRPDTIVFLQR